MIGGSGDKMYLVKGNFEIYLSDEILQLDIKCKTEAKLDYYAINNTLSVDSRKLLISGNGPLMKSGNLESNIDTLFRPLVSARVLNCFSYCNLKV